MTEWGALVDKHRNRWRARRVAPGLYEDDEGAVHIVAAELLIAAGCAATEENCQMLMEAAREFVTREWPGVRVVSE